MGPHLFLKILMLTEDFQEYLTHITPFAGNIVIFYHLTWAF